MADADLVHGWRRGAVAEITMVGRDLPGANVQADSRRTTGVSAARFAWDQAREGITALNERSPRGWPRRTPSRG